MDYNYVALEPYGSAINGTNGNLWVAGDYGGKLTFLAQENGTGIIHTSIGGVKWNGGVVDEGSEVSVLAGTVYTLEWSYTVTPWISLTLILGLMGLGMGLGGPFYIVSKWRDDHDIKGMVSGTVITLVGFALILGWLWL